MFHITLPLILTLAVCSTGTIWLLDAFVIAHFRKGVIATNYNSDLSLHPKIISAINFSKKYFFAFLLIFIVRSFLFEPCKIPSVSMSPTLNDGDYILVNKFSYGLRLPVLDKKLLSIGTPERGDVMIFRPPHIPHRYYIKRVIGLPGDRIAINNNILSINGHVLNRTHEKLLDHPSHRKSSVETIGEKEVEIYTFVQPSFFGRSGAWVVPDGNYFVMGDNRDESSDSRDWGFVPDDLIVGKATAVWMYWDKFLSAPSFENVRIIK